MTQLSRDSLGQLDSGSSRYHIAQQPSHIRHLRSPALLWSTLVTLGEHRDCDDLSVQTLSRAVTDDGIKCLLIGTAKSGADHIPRRWDQTEILAVGPDYLDAGSTSNVDTSG